MPPAPAPSALCRRGARIHQRVCRLLLRSVGLFRQVRPAQEVKEVSGQRYRLDVLQFHGDAPADFCQQFFGAALSKSAYECVPVIRLKCAGRPVAELRPASLLDS